MDLRLVFAVKLSFCATCKPYITTCLSFSSVAALHFNTPFLISIALCCALAASSLLWSWPFSLSKSHCGARTSDPVCWLILVQETWKCPWYLDNWEGMHQVHSCQIELPILQWYDA